MALLTGPRVRALFDASVFRVGPPQACDLQAGRIPSEVAAHKHIQHSGTIPRTIQPNLFDGRSQSLRPASWRMDARCTAAAPSGRCHCCNTITPACSRGATAPRRATVLARASLSQLPPRGRFSCATYERVLRYPDGVRVLRYPCVPEESEDESGRQAAREQLDILGLASPRAGSASTSPSPQSYNEANMPAEVGSAAVSPCNCNDFVGGAAVAGSLYATGLLSSCAAWFMRLVLHANCH